MPRRRHVIFLLVALGLILLPFSMFNFFEGFENRQDGLLPSFPDHSYDLQTQPEKVNTLHDVPSALRPTPSLTPSPSFPARADLPKRKLTPYVNPLIGTEGFGHCTILFFRSFLIIAFAGATIPFGMAKAVADSSTAWQNQAGFLHDNSKIKGFSQMHDEGTGGQPSLGNFPISVSNCGGSDWDSCPTTSTFRSTSRVGEPRSEVGSFGIRTNTGYDIGILYSSMFVPNNRYDFHKKD